MGNKLQLMSIISEMINEVGDLKNIISYPYTTYKRGGDYVGRFKAEVNGEEQDITVLIERSSPSFKDNLTLPPVFEKNGDLYNISFDVSGNDAQFAKTNLSLYLKILKTVTEIVNDVISETDVNPPNNTYMIGSVSKEGITGKNDTKLRYYKAILNSNLPAGYRMAEGKFYSFNILALQKTK